MRTHSITSVCDTRLDNFLRLLQARYGCKFFNRRSVYKMRTINVIATEIDSDWKKVNYAARPYLDAMYTLMKVSDSYYLDSGEGVVLRFLANAGTWRGETAKRVKLELKAMVK